jgi:uncharacterized protein (TIGR03086 family)
VHPLDALDRSTEPLIALASRIAPDEWSASTPCTDWDVRALVGHLIATNRAYVELLNGAPAARLLELMAGQRTAGDDDPVAALTEAVGSMRAAFAEPGALARSVTHPMGSLDGTQLLGWRVIENVIHASDLARALDVDVDLDASLVDGVYEQLAPMAGALASPGYFNAPTQQLPDDATTIERLLHIVGR